MKVLFVVEDVTLAHLARTVVLAQWVEELMTKDGRAQALVASGENYPICFNGYTGKRRKIPARNPATFAALLKKGGILFPEKILIEQLAQDLALIEEFNPDLVVGDMRPSLAVASSLKNLPLLTVTNGYWSADSHHGEFPTPYFPLGATPWHIPILGGLVSSGWKALTSKMLSSALSAQGAGINRLRTRAGLLPYADYISGFVHGDATLFCDVAEVCGIEQSAVAAHYVGQHCIGPIAWAPQIAAPSWWAEVTKQNNKERVAYLNLGSSGDSNSIPLIAHALLAAGWTTIIGGITRLPNTLADHSRIFHAPLLPGDLILQHVSLMVTNGGSPSGYQALTAGVPVIGIPLNMDQLLFSKVLERFGSGLMVRVDQLTSKTFAKTLIDFETKRDRIVDRARSSKELISKQNTQARFLEIVKGLCERKQYKNRSSENTVENNWERLVGNS